MANLDFDEKAGAPDTTIMTAVFDASIVNGKTSHSNPPDHDVRINVEYPFSALHNPLQLSHFESITLPIPDETIDKQMAKANVMEMIMNSNATKIKIYTSQDATHNQTSASPRSTETRYADSGQLQKCTISLKAQLTTFAPGQISLNGKTAAYAPECGESKKASYFNEMSLPRSKLSEVHTSNQQKCQGKPSYVNVPTSDAAINFDYPFSDIHDPLQLWESESVPLCIPKGIADESMSSEEKVMDWLRSTLKAETHNQAQSSLSTPSADSGRPLKRTTSLSAQLPLFASARIEHDGESPIYIPDFGQSTQMSQFKDMSLPGSKSSKVLKSNQRKCLGMQLRRRSFDSSSSHQHSSSVTTTVDKCMSPASSVTQIFEHSLIDQSVVNDASFTCSDITCKDRFPLELHQEDSFSDICSNGSPPKFARHTKCCATRVCYSKVVGINVMSPKKILKPRKFYPMNY